MRTMKKRMKKKMMNPTYDSETALIKLGCKYVAGTDEAGAGSIVGPVVAAAVILDKDNIDSRIKDSKELSKKKREELYDVIVESCISCAVGINTVERIDEINILWARLEAMKKAIESIDFPIDHVLVDGDRKVPDLKIDQTAIIKGDGKVYSIAAASIIAKVTRDRMLAFMGKEWTKYGLDSNKGYWCKKIVNQVKKDGYIKDFHRKVFIRKILYG